MNTFLAYPDFKQSLISLDYTRHGKQRVEAKQIHNTLTGNSQGWKNHKAVKMWKGYEEALKLYHNIAIETWIIKKYKNNMPLFDISSKIEFPKWLGNKDFHDSHKSNLLRKGKTDAIVKYLSKKYGKYKDWHWRFNLPKSKNMITIKQINYLHKQECPNFDVNKYNWYTQFNWNIPDNLPYIWPK